jgi:outer membrane protein assembly factor BamB
LLVEKDYSIGRHGALKIKMSDERIILTLEIFEPESNKYDTKIIAFNTDLTQVWEKTYNGAIGLGETLNSKTQTLVFIHNDNITCLNAKNGESKWAVNSNIIGVGNQRPVFQAEHTQDGGALIVNLSFYDSELRKYIQNILAVLNPSTGKIEFKEAQGGSSESLKIIPIRNKFVLIKDSQILEFTNVPKQ